MTPRHKHAQVKFSLSAEGSERRLPRFIPPLPLLSFIHREGALESSTASRWSHKITDGSTATLFKRHLCYSDWWLMWGCVCVCCVNINLFILISLQNEQIQFSLTPVWHVYNGSLACACVFLRVCAVLPAGLFKWALSPPDMWLALIGHRPSRWKPCGCQRVKRSFQSVDQSAVGLQPGENWPAEIRLICRRWSRCWVDETPVGPEGDTLDLKSQSELFLAGKICW